jgi:carbon storage regulator
MLVLTRKIGERIVLLDGEIIITVLEHRGRQVRIGIAAPPSVSIQREEVAITARTSLRNTRLPRKG